MKITCVCAVGAIALLTGAAITGCGSGGRVAPPRGMERPVSFPAHPTAETPGVKKLRAAVKGANVVIVVLDAARADHFGCYGYARETSPNFDRLANESVVFENHFCQYPRTDVSTMSLFTGQYPDTHLQGRTGGDVDLSLAAMPWSLPQTLRASGYQTACFVSRPMLASSLGESGVFDMVEGGSRGARRAALATKLAPETLLQTISSWLKTRSAGPLFAYVHLHPPHTPYSAPQEMQERFAHSNPPGAWRGQYPFGSIKPDLAPPKGDPSQQSFTDWVNKYDANLRWGDWAVGQIERLLRDAGLLDATIFIVTSDHGEAFGEHGYIYHSFGVYDELVHIPLIVRLPGGRVRKRIAALTQTVDVAPTIVDLLYTVGETAAVQGSSLLPLITGDAQDVNDCVFARAAGQPPSYLVRNREWALVLYQGAQLRALYDLKGDPEQRRNVLPQFPERVAELEDAFRAFAHTQKALPFEFVDSKAKPIALPAPARPGLSDEDRRELRALGYLD